MLAGLEVLILRDEFRQSYVPTELVGIGIVGLAELLDLARPDLKVLLVVCQCLFCLLGAKPMKTLHSVSVRSLVPPQTQLSSLPEGQMKRPSASSFPLVRAA